ncbi:MAG: heme NO-binding domain-containing protein [Planctomycetales bacterium]|nr:heme NO-binding domain-containing protein [Planctomycetales bacterium]
MRGIVFTEFQQLVEERFGMAMYDRLVCTVETETQGAYTSVGNYDYHELLRLVEQLSKVVDIPISDLVKVFGHHLFKSFVRAYPYSVVGITNTAELMQSVESVIHVEVSKLNPDAELPMFKLTELGEDDLEIVYESTRPFADLAQGLIEASIEYFEDGYGLTREDLSNDGTSARFLLTAKAGVTACMT